MRKISKLGLSVAILFLLIAPTIPTYAQESSTINDIPLEGLSGPNDTIQQQDTPVLEGISTYDEQESQKSFRNFILGGIGLLAILTLPILIIVVIVIVRIIRSKKKKQE